MRFWDSSAIVPLVCHEDSSALIQSVYAQDEDVLVWAFTRTEILSAICRHRRGGSLSGRELADAKKRLAELAMDWSENCAFERVRERAERILEVHPLTAADSLQLAAALVAVEEHTADFGFVTLDERLGEAATKEGFAVLGCETA